MKAHKIKNSDTLIIPFGFHPWTGTQHCLREDGGCTNDHTGCLYNDSNNGCGHPHKTAISPLLTKEKLDINQ